MPCMLKTKNTPVEWIRSHSYVILAVIIFFQVLVMVYYLDQKNGYHLDEIYSHTQANGQLNGYLGRNDVDLYNNWHTSDYFFESLTVQYGERLEFKPVYQALSRNVHPPFYHMQLHAVYSLFLNTWSKWLAGSLNLFWFIAASIMLYLASRLILTGRFLALLPNAVWGFSTGAISSIVFFRMYVVLTFFFVALVYLGLLIIGKNTKANLKYCIALSLVIFFGLFTHLYFIIFFALAAFAVLLWLLYKKEYKQLRNCAVTVATTLVVYYFCWPSVAQQLRSYRGEQSIANFFDVNDFADRIKSFGSIINRELFGGMQLFFVFAMLALLGFVIIRLLIQKKDPSQISRQKTHTALVCFVFMLFCTVPYFLIIVKIAPYMTDRYIFAIYPILFLLIIKLFHALLQRINSRISTVIVALSLFLILSDCSDKNVAYLYKNDPDISQIIQDYETTSCIYIPSSSNNYIELYFPDFALFDRTYICKSTDDLTIALEGVNGDDDLLLYLSRAMDNDSEILNDIRSMLPHQEISLLYKTHSYNVYHTKGKNGSF